MMDWRGLGLLALGALLLVGGDGLRAQDARGEAGKFFKSLDVNDDGILKRDEVAEEQYKFFDRMVRAGDTDGNGELTRAEFVEVLKKMNRAGNKQGDGQQRRRGDFSPEEMFRRLDADGDKRITRDEVPEPARQRLFPLFDRLGKDELTLEDLETIRQQQTRQPQQELRPPEEGREPREPRPDRMMPDPRHPPFPPPFFHLLDRDHNGLISKDELSKAADIYDELNHNRDEGLDVAELMGPPPQGGPPRPGFGGPPPRFDERRPDGERMPPRDGHRPEERDAPPRERASAGDHNPDQERKAGPEGGDKLSEIFSRLDRDADGQLSEGELPERLREKIGQVDKNEDGKISEDEFVSGARRALQQRQQGERPPAQ